MINQQDEDRLLQEDPDEIPSGQPDPASRDRDREREPTHRASTSRNRRETKLTPDNWNIVKRLSNKSRDIIGIRERTRHLLRRSHLQIDQTIRPTWLACRQNPPLLPGTVAFPAEFHEEWSKTTAKYEKKLIKKVTKYLPQIISSLDIRLENHRQSAQETIKREISDGEQIERAIGLFLNFSNKAEQEAPLHKPASQNRRN